MRQRHRIAALIVTALPWGTLLGGSGETDARNALSRSEVPNFALLDHRGTFHELDYVLRSPEVKGLALFVQGNGCPLVRKRVPHLKRLREAYGDRGIVIAMINVNYQDEREDIAEEAEEFGIDFPILVDESQMVAEMLGIDRTGEAILIASDSRRIVYRGAVDDRMSYQKEKPEASDAYLKDAIEAMLKGEPIVPAETEAIGCKVSFPGAEGATISYSEQIVPILKNRCVSCHTKDGIGPFALSNYRKVRGWSEMMEEVILTRQMPPWHADPHIGKFRKQAGLTPEEERTLISWIRAGAPRGEGEDGLDGYAPEVKEWALGQPDEVIELPEQSVPAEGVIPYRYVHVDGPFDEDVWLSGLEVNPGNTQVLHHVVVTAFPKGSSERERRRGGRWITGYAPGTGAQWLPEGTGVFLPQGLTLRFQLHYTTSGKAETDRTRLGLHLAKEKPAKEFKGHIVNHPKFEIPPHAPEHSERYTLPVKKNMLLYAMNPHMHYRGKWMRFDLRLPDGEQRPLLSVPNYNFNWQRTYRYVEPQPIPAGSQIVITNAWDNSSLNPHNPDPSQAVRWGEQTFEEMFFASMYFVDAD